MLKHLAAPKKFEEDSGRPARVQPRDLSLCFARARLWCTPAALWSVDDWLRSGQGCPAQRSTATARTSAEVRAVEHELRTEAGVWADARAARCRRGS